MKIAIVGNKEFGNRQLVSELIGQIRTVDSKILTTAMPGPCTWAFEEAKLTGYQHKIFNIPKGPHDADVFKMHCNERNQKLVDEADLIVCFLDKWCSNTYHLIDLAMRAQKMVYLVPDLPLHKLEALFEVITNE